MRFNNLVRAVPGRLRNGLSSTARATLLFVCVLGLVAVPVAAHNWQTTVTNGEYELGLNSNPRHPVAGIQTDFVARITDTNVEQGDDHRLNGGVVNKTVTVMFTAPDGTMVHEEVHISADNPHFHFSHVFLQSGVYDITISVPIDGETVTFEVHREVSLLPTNPAGGQLAELNQHVADLQQRVRTVTWIAGAAALFSLLTLVSVLVVVFRVDR